MFNVLYFIHYSNVVTELNIEFYYIIYTKHNLEHANDDVIDFNYFIKGLKYFHQFELLQI